MEELRERSECVVQINHKPLSSKTEKEKGIESSDLFIHKLKKRKRNRKFSRGKNGYRGIESDEYALRRSCCSASMDFLLLSDFLTLFIYYL